MTDILSPSSARISRNRKTQGIDHLTPPIVVQAHKKIYLKKWELCRGHSLHSPGKKWITRFVNGREVKKKDWN